MHIPRAERPHRQGGEESAHDGGRRVRTSRATTAAAQADAQLRAADVLAADLKSRNLWPLFDDVEMPLMAVLARMELTGVAVDAAPLVEMSREMQTELQGIEREIYAVVGHEFNIGSPQQLSHDAVRRAGAAEDAASTKLGYTTDALAMDGLRGAHPVVDLIMRYRGISKLKSTYVDALPALINPKTKRIHTTFNQATAATGRLSSNDPNLQNIPVRTGYGNRIRTRLHRARHRQGADAAGGGLLADRAADHGAPEPGPRAHRRRSRTTRTSTPRRRRTCSACRSTR